MYGDKMKTSEMEDTIKAHSYYKKPYAKKLEEERVKVNSFFKDKERLIKEYKKKAEKNNNLLTHEESKRQVHSETIERYTGKSKKDKNSDKKYLNAKNRLKVLDDKIRNIKKEIKKCYNHYFKKVKECNKKILKSYKKIADIEGQMRNKLIQIDKELERLRKD